MDRDSGGSCDILARSFFEALFIFADKDDKGELVVEDLEMLFQVTVQSSLPSLGVKCHCLISSQGALTPAGATKLFFARWRSPPLERGKHMTEKRKGGRK